MLTQSEAVTVPYSIFANVSFEHLLSILQISSLLFIHEFYGINYQMSKLADKYSPKIQKSRQLQGGFAPWPSDQGLCPWTPLGTRHSPQTPLWTRAPRSPYLAPPSQIPGSALGSIRLTQDSGDPPYSWPMTHGSHWKPYWLISGIGIWIGALYSLILN